MNKGFVALLFTMIGLVVLVTVIVYSGILSGDGSVIENSKNAIDRAKEATKNFGDKYKFDPEAQEKSIDDLN